MICSSSTRPSYAYINFIEILWTIFAQLHSDFRRCSFAQWRRTVAIWANIRKSLRSTYATWRITDKWRGGLGEWAMSKIQKYNLISCIFNFLFIFHNECPQQQQSIASNARTHTIEFAACAIVRKRWWLLVLHCPQSAPHRRSRRNNNRETAALRWELTRDKKFT